MQTNELDSGTIRRLAEMREDSGKVLSLYINFDPSEFATAQARSTAIRSLLDDGERRVKDAQGLSHDEKTSLRADLNRVSEFFKGADFSGAHALAVFCSAPLDLFEVLKLPRPVDSELVIDDSPFVEPLADLASSGDWCIVLVNRRTARILRGSRERLDQVARIDDEVHGRHDQGGWSQARFQRGVEKEAQDHVKNTADALFRHFKRSAFQRLIVGCHEELWPEVEAALHSYVKERLVGRIDVDVENTGPREVLEAASPLIEEYDRRREREMLDRLAEGRRPGGRAAVGLEAVLAALNERRVEVLLFDQGFSAGGVVCRECQWVGAGGTACPVDGGELEPREDILENAVELAITQAAEVLVLRYHDDLEPSGSIGAVLRF